ncbi:MAG: hypothetical protein A4E34_02195 [Methanoregula sp. PtaU1.Bin006]|uniref:hypothetical protein n=1 Tax=Methanoregula sp. PtaU1.Bin006 TaxID=1811681 RepID=UPI0009D270E7|nr:hypothetical protein [Methanoregula sp. PtaU1.Bin006]OPY32818.1 MAG: hypothetical protein A4E34_02195 [Methanoregula sp. PtaU1.Bin006]
MPRRPAFVIPKIPQFLIGAVAGREATKAGEALVRIVIREVKGHLFDISVHTRAMCRRVFRYRPKLPALPETGPEVPGFYAGVADP